MVTKGLKDLFEVIAGQLALLWFFPCHTGYIETPFTMVTTLSKDLFEINAG